MSQKPGPVGRATAIASAILGLAAATQGACTFAISVDRSRIDREGAPGVGGNSGASGSTSGVGTTGGGDKLACSDETVSQDCGVDSVCRVFMCVEGACAVQDAAVGSPCDDDGGVTCDGKGNCVEAHCANGVRDADESDVDCGGAICRLCIVDEACGEANDCASGICDEGQSSGAGGGPGLGKCVPCVSSGDCPSGHHCDPDTGGCEPQGGLGEACASGAACSSGQCSDGVCCDTPCDELCAACVEAKTGLPSGTCRPVQQGFDPDGECIELASACRAGGCSGTVGACAAAPDTTVCRPAAGECDVAESCDGTSAACPDDDLAAFGTGSCPSGSACDGLGAGFANCKKLPGENCAAPMDCLQGECFDGSCPVEP